MRASCLAKPTFLKREFFFLKWPKHNPRENLLLQLDERLLNSAYLRDLTRNHVSEDLSHIFAFLCICHSGDRYYSNAGTDLLFISVLILNILMLRVRSEC
jgi:hypothetical protein